MRHDIGNLVLFRQLRTSRQRTLARVASAALLLVILVTGLRLATAGNTDLELAVTIIGQDTAVVVGKHFEPGSTVALAVTTSKASTTFDKTTEDDGRFAANFYLPSNYTGAVSVRATAGNDTVTGRVDATGTGSPVPENAPAIVSSDGKWTLTFSDDFTKDVKEGSFLSTYRRWDAYPKGWKDTSQNGTYDPGILSVSGGVLNMRIHTTADGVHHVAAPEPNNGNGQIFGRYETRFRADSLPGYKTAWLLWPKSDNWNEGEIDFPEGSLDKKIGAFSHYTGNPRSQDSFPTNATYDTWHTAVIEWTPGKVVFSLDGQVIGTSTKNVPSTPFRWVLQTETNIDAPAPADDVEGNVQVDYVRLWRWNG